MANHSLETLLQAATECHKALDAAKIAHVVIGGLAVCLHWHEWTSRRDVDLLVRSDDMDKVRRALKSPQFVWPTRKKACHRSTEVRIDFRYGCKDAGNGEVCQPDPADNKAREIICGLPVLVLVRLIETKLASGLKGKRYEKHFEPVAALIAAKNLSHSDANSLHKSVRAKFCELVDQQAAGGSPDTFLNY